MGLLASGGSGFISGSFTSAEVIANFVPSSNPGLWVSTSDMGLMQSDGVRWNVIGTPPIPPGAATLSYNKNVYTVFPTVNDIGYGNYPGQYRIYSGWNILGSEPTSAAYTTASNGQLQLIFTGTGNSPLLTTIPYASAHLASNVGQLPFALASVGFYFEIAFTLSGNNSDYWPSFFLFPQEHNLLKDDSNPSFPTNYEQWHEFDINEGGHGTDHSGAYRGAYHQWAGVYNWSRPLAAAYSAGTTSISLATAWTGETGEWTITFSSGEQRTVNLQNGSAGPYAITALSNNETTAATISYTGLVVTSNIQTAALDYTAEHIFGGAYDPFEQTFTIWQDGVMQSQISTSNVNSANTFRDSLHYMPIIQCQSQGSNLPYTMNVRYFSLWTP